MDVKGKFMGKSMKKPAARFFAGRRAGAGRRDQSAMRDSISSSRESNRSRAAWMG